MKAIETQKSKEVWVSPQIKVHGTVEQITQQRKSLGNGDGFILVIPGIGDVPIRDYGS